MPVAVGGDQDPGFDLPETIQHAPHAEIGRGGGKDRAERSGGQQGDHGLGHIRQPGRHAVAGRDARGLERGRERRHLAVERVMRECAIDPVLAPKDQRVGLVPAAQQVFRVIQSGFREPLSPRHPLAMRENGARPLADDRAIIPYGRPKGGRLANRPMVQGRVVGRREVGPRPPHKGREFRGLHLPF